MVMVSVKKNKQVLTKISFLSLLFILSLGACKKNPAAPQPPNPPDQTIFQVTNNTINGTSFNSTQTLHGININPAIRISFSDKVDRNTISSAISYNNKTQNLSVVPYAVSYQNNDSTIIISPSNAINYL